MKRLLFAGIIALGRALRVVAVPLAMMLSCVAIGQQLAPVVARPTPAELAFGAACVALGVLGIGWVRWQTDATVRELIGWVLGFRLACVVIPFDPVALVAVFAFALARFAPRCLIARSRGWLAAPSLVALLGLAAFAIIQIDHRRPTPDPGREWCSTEGEPGGIAVLGDSSSYGMGIPAAGRYSRLIGASVNCAQPGAPSSKLAAQLAEAEAAQPRAVVVYVGPNDRYADGWRERLRANLDAIVDRNRLAGRETIMVTYPFGSRVLPGWLTDLNAIVRNTRGAMIVDAARDVRSPLAFLIDDIHPSSVGHRQIAALISRHLAGLPDGSQVAVAEW